MAIQITEILPCPFCGFDAEAGWVVHEGRGKSFRVACSRDGECPSPEWVEDPLGYLSDADLVESVINFWNTRSADWSEDGWQSFKGTKPKVPVLVYTIERASQRKQRQMFGDQASPYQPYQIAVWRKGEWRNPSTGEICNVRAWKHVKKPGFV